MAEVEREFQSCGAEEEFKLYLLLDLTPVKVL